MTDKARELLEPVAYWDTQNGTLVAAVPLVSKRSCYKVEPVPLFLHPALRPEFVRLSEEEVSEILSLAHTPYEAICAAENRLARKNA